MALRVRTAVPLTLAVGALFMMVVAELASAGHVRPKGASPIRVVDGARVQPVQRTRTGRTGRRLAVPSCNPPVQASTPSRSVSRRNNGAAANSVGFVQAQGEGRRAGSARGLRRADHRATEPTFGARPGTTDLRQRKRRGRSRTTPASWRATPRSGSRTTGTGLRPVGGTDPATVVDIPFPVDAGCAATASTTIGANVHRQHVGQRDRAGCGQGQQAGGRRDRPAADLRRRARRSRRDRARTRCSQCRASSSPNGLQGEPANRERAHARSRSLPARGHIRDVRARTTGLDQSAVVGITSVEDGKRTRDGRPCARVSGSRAARARRAVRMHRALRRQRGRRGPGPLRRARSRRCSTASMRAASSSATTAVATCPSRSPTTTTRLPRPPPTRCSCSCAR